MPDVTEFGRRRDVACGFAALFVVCGSVNSAACSEPLELTAPTLYEVGVAAIDITPTHPIRLNGFGNRRAESDGVRQRIWAKALAIGSDAEGPAVLITVDILGIPDRMAARIAERLAAQTAVRRERVTLTATHTHSAPMLTGELPTIFGRPIPPEHQAHIDEYTRTFEAKLELVALDALAARKPAVLKWGIGSAGFAENRRTPGGPVDHDLPLLAVCSPEGTLRAVHFSYACHCVTLSDNKISGDWAGYAQAAIERDFPNVIALCSVGCGADSNPISGVMHDRADIALSQGEEIAAEVRRLLSGYLAPISGPLTCRFSRVELPLQPLPPRDYWEKLAKLDSAVGHHARVQLAKLDRGESLIERLAVPLQSWTFGDSLAVLFLPGETVVDYSLRLKRELDAHRVWVVGYANAAPGYIPSERVLQEGGYEGGGAMIYYDIPMPYAPGLEDKIIEELHRQVGERFDARIDVSRTGGHAPLSAQQSAARLRVRPEMDVQLVAAEPLVVDPVAITFGPDGRLWVVEMYDYPTRVPDDSRSGGRIRVLEDADGDGCYDTASLFLDGIPYPTGVTMWRDGVLICSAPDILYAEDTDGDGRADVRKVLYTGFGTENHQARVNSLCYGLDGWVYGSCGLFGGTITSISGGEPLSLGNRDFRIQPDAGRIEPATGRTQQGRARDDWGHWFGCNSGSLLHHYPLGEHQLRRNPELSPPSARVSVAPSNRLYPIIPPLLHKLSGPPGVVTSACGLTIYRDRLLGDEFTGNSFTCEPVSQVVHRLRLAPKGTRFFAARAIDELDQEFLASADPWFRPVQALTGPDGALWVVDMSRYVIEHPQWIPPDETAELDLRAGDDRGRIYRVFPRESPPRDIVRLDRLDAAGLVDALDTPNGPQRDLAAQMLQWRNDPQVAPVLRKQATAHPRAETRLQALCVLERLGELWERTLLSALADKHPGVRRQAIRMAQQRLADSPALLDSVLQQADDAHPFVRLPLAYCLGETGDPRAAQALVELVRTFPDDDYLVAGVLSSAHLGNVAAMLVHALTLRNPAVLERLIPPLMGVAAVTGQHQAVIDATGAITSGEAGDQSWHMAALAKLLQILSRERVLSGEEESLTVALDDRNADRVRAMLARLRRVAIDSKVSAARRAAAVAPLGYLPAESADDLAHLEPLLSPRQPACVQLAAVDALSRINDPSSIELLLDGWAAFTPQVRGAVFDAAVSRPEWIGRVVAAVEAGTITPASLDATRMQRLVEHLEDAVRDRLRQRVLKSTAVDRQAVLDEYADVPTLTGDPANGETLFAKTCASCHRLGTTGHHLGPDLSALTNRTPEYLMTAVLDPSRAVASQFINYIVLTETGRMFSGMLVEESANSISLGQQAGQRQSILRSEIEELRSTGKSFMPDGLEKDLKPQHLADLIAFLQESDAPRHLKRYADDTPEQTVQLSDAEAADAQTTAAQSQSIDADRIAVQLLDESLSREQCEELIQTHLEAAPSLIAALTRNLPEGEEEYRRIPWIWRVSIAAGRRNEAALIRPILELSLPGEGRPLRHWQAVVIGGGIINGISQQNLPPRQRIAELISNDTQLTARWKRLLEQSATMADDEAVPSGTRYDALRILGCGDWTPRGEHLRKYLADGTHAELQMGAVSGLSDLRSPESTAALIAALRYLQGRNRELALDALLVSEPRIEALLDTLARGDLTADQLGPDRINKLRRHPNTMIRERAALLLQE